MNRDAVPMPTLSEEERRARKPTMWRIQHQQRLEQATEADPAPWLAAVARDIATIRRF